MGARQLGAVMPESFALVYENGGRHLEVVFELFSEPRLESGVGLLGLAVAVRGGVLAEIATLGANLRRVSLFGELLLDGLIGNGRQPWELRLRGFCALLLVMASLRASDTPAPAASVCRSTRPLGGPAVALRGSR